jgi:WD40 repeat protein
LAFSPDGKSLAIGRKIWSLTGELEADFSVPVDDDVEEAGFVMDGRGLLLATRSRTPDGTPLDVTVTDIGTGQSVPFLPGRTDDIVHVSVASPDEVLVARGSGEVDLIDGTTGALRQQVDTGESLAFGLVELSADGRRIAVAPDTSGLVSVWDVDRRQLAGKIASGGASSIALDDDGSTVATGRIDGTVALWDVGSGTQKGKLAASERVDEDETVTDLTFVGDGRALLSFTPTGRVVRWDLDPRSWRRQACTVAGRTLTPAEVSLYLSGTATARPCEAR